MQGLRRIVQMCALVLCVVDVRVTGAVDLMNAPLKKEEISEFLKQIIHYWNRHADSGNGTKLFLTDRTNHTLLRGQEPDSGNAQSGALRYIVARRETAILIPILTSSDASDNDNDNQSNYFDRHYPTLSTSEPSRRTTFGRSYAASPTTASTSVPTNGTRSTPKPLMRPKSCADLQSGGYNNSGLFSLYLYPGELQPYREVYCDLDGGGGWTVIQWRGRPSSSSNRTSESTSSRENFNRTMGEYGRGFGSVGHGDFWLGLDKIQRLCNKTNPCEMLIEMEDWEGSSRFAKYKTFSLNNVPKPYVNYKATFQGYVGNAGDALADHDGLDFSAWDEERDYDGERNCGLVFGSGWWFRDCYSANLNGVYPSTVLGRTNYKVAGVSWNLWKGNQYSLKQVQIKVRPKRFINL